MLPFSVFAKSIDMPTVLASNSEITSDPWPPGGPIITDTFALFAWAAALSPDSTIPVFPNTLTDACE
jgi:hypothetical protein